MTSGHHEHKKVIVALFLQNVQTPDIARKICHTEEKCDRYIRAFKRVKILFGCMSPLEIAQTTLMSERLVNEYITLIEEPKNLSLMKLTTLAKLIFDRSDICRHFRIMDEPGISHLSRPVLKCLSSCLNSDSRIPVRWGHPT